MDVETYDQIALNEDAIGDSLKFVKENEMVKICSHNGNVFAVEPPLFVELAITETEQDLKEIQHRVRQNQLLWRQEQLYTYRCL